MTVKVKVSDRARYMLLEAEEHWLNGHEFGDNPLLVEVSHAVERLRTMPELGIVHRHRDARGAEIRRVLLSSGWHLYYTYDPDAEIISVIAVWFATRGSAPPL